MHNRPTNHHYVPKCYLKEFTDYKKNLYQLILGHGKTIIKNPSQVCYEPFYFNIKTETFKQIYNISSETYIEEHAFKYQENSYHKAIKPFTKFTQYPFSVPKNTSIRPANPVF